MSIVKLNANVREGTTKSELKGIRSRGQIPATVYGKKLDSISIVVGEKEIKTLLRGGNRYGVIEMELQGQGKYPVVVSEIQKHKINGSLLHIDFHQVNMKEPINTTVSLDFTGKAKGISEGGVLQIRRHDLEIRCLPNQIPGQLQVDIEQLGLGDNLNASQVELPEGVELRTDPLEVLLTILMPQKDAEQAEDNEAEEQATEAAE